MVGGELRTFRVRSSYLLLTLFKSLVQPHLDYCSQLWSSTHQCSINKIEQVQKSLVSRISDKRLVGLNYWRKLKDLHLYTVECTVRSADERDTWLYSSGRSPRGWFLGIPYHSLPELAGQGGKLSQPRFSSLLQLL